MIHKVKALYDNGHGLSKRAIAEQLNLSRNTVRKYLRMSEDEISQYLAATDRMKVLDAHRDFLVHLLQTYPKLSAVKLQRKLTEKHPDIQVSDRTIRRYVNQLRQTVCSKQQRYYEPVLDMTPGVQCQVDPGELRGVSVGGVETIVYFVVFVLSYSRLMYVALSSRPIDTTCFIRMHDAAFRYFGGVSEECVYDQTKLVVLNEFYRELEVNSRFHEYATHSGFRLHACEGYDPESKGKVEAGVKYVKQNALYGDAFSDWSALEAHVAEWLDGVANVRCHGATGVPPRQRYEEEERAQMKAYLTPAVVRSAGQAVTRKADKTGLICWRANKYSVPLPYQRATLGVEVIEDQLCLYDLESNEEIARHRLSQGKGKVIKNTHHYRDPSQRVEALEQDLRELIAEPYAAALCALLKQTQPKIYKDQLLGVKRLLSQYSPVSPALLEPLCQRSRLTAAGVKAYLEAYSSRPERLHDTALAAKVSSDLLQRYAPLAEQEVGHDLH